MRHYYSLLDEAALACFSALAQRFSGWARGARGRATHGLVGWLVLSGCGRMVHVIDVSISHLR
jgi:hypothetical protein